jgi:hypothetical protein
VRAILSDISIQGQVNILALLLASDDWREIWTSLNLTVLTFRDLGLAPDTSDAEIWRLCQQQQIVFITANRNSDSPDSLEPTIRNENRPQSLPVFTLADAQQVQYSREYAERVVERLLDYLLDIDKYRGTGRLYLP